MPALPALTAVNLFRFDWPENLTIRQMALSPDGVLHVGSSAGLWALRGKDWQQVQVLDAGGRAWAVGRRARGGVRLEGAVVVRHSRPVSAARPPRAGVSTRARTVCPGTTLPAWPPVPRARFGLPRTLGRFDSMGREWQYRQGPRWLPNDDVAQVAVDRNGHRLVCHGRWRRLH